MSVLLLEDHPFQLNDAPNTFYSGTVPAYSNVIYIHPDEAQTICNQIAEEIQDRFSATCNLAKNEPAVNGMKELFHKCDQNAFKLL